MKRRDEDDLSERLTELFVLAAAICFKLQAWEERPKKTPHVLLACRHALCATALDLMRLSDHALPAVKERFEYARRGLQELSDGLNDTCTLASEIGSPKVEDALRMRAKKLDTAILKIFSDSA